MKSRKLFALVLAGLVTVLASGAELMHPLLTAGKIVRAEGVRVRDPFVRAFPDEGLYRLYEGAPFGGLDGIAVRTSKDLKNWSEPRRVLDPSSVRSVDAKVTGPFFTPRYAFWRGRHYLFVAIGQKDALRGVWAFASENPEGPFRLVADKPVTPPGLRAHDGSLWVEDGKPYLLYCQEWVQDGLGRIFLAPLADDLTHTIGEPKLLVKGTDWTGLDVRQLRRTHYDRIADGPSLFRSQTGALYLLWSNRLVNYGQTLHVSESASGRAEGPWVHHRMLWACDAGHGSILRSLDGRLLLACHLNGGVLNPQLAFTEVVDDVKGLRVKRSDQRYRAIPGGFEITDGDAEFTRPLLGSHWADNPRRIRKNWMLTGDRPCIALLRHPLPHTPKASPSRDILEFGKDRTGITYRYVEGRAEYAFADGAHVTLVRAVDSDDLLVEVKGSVPPVATGAWKLVKSETLAETTYYQFGRVHDAPLKSLAASYVAATNEVAARSRVIRVSTPDPLLDSAVACANLSCDAILEGDFATCSASAWHLIWCGWRSVYAPVVLGMTESFKRSAQAYCAAQHPDGRIPCGPFKNDGPYNMCDVYVDSFMLYWEATGDLSVFRDGAYTMLKRYLAWLDRYRKVPNCHLYENYLNAWNTDDKWTNGGGGTVATAYAWRAYETMAQIAAKLGETADAAAFRASAEAIKADALKLLYDDQVGVWGEFREFFGEGRLKACPDLSSVYTMVDRGFAAPVQAHRSLLWLERNIPSAFAEDGAAFIYSSNWLPVFFSVTGLYPQETFNFAHAWFVAGESELGWRHFRDAISSMARGTEAGPGELTMEVDEDLRNYAHRDFGDTSVAMLRTVTEGVFGIHLDAGRGQVLVQPGFPSSWNEAEIETPYFSYRWTRAGGVEVTKNPRHLAVTVKQTVPTLVGDKMPRPHTRWGMPKGDGTAVRPSGAEPRFVSLAGVVNRNWRTLHQGTYTLSSLTNFPWSGLPRVVRKNGRSWWEQCEAVSDWSSDRGRYNVPVTMDWPADNRVRTPAGHVFVLGACDGTNGAFCARCPELPQTITVPLSGKASSLSFLVALSTNPNLTWMEALRATVTYVDGGTEMLKLVPPDNCDDWLNYLQVKPYHLTGEHVMFGAWAHANVLTIPVDPNRPLATFELKCIACETIGGLLALTLE